MPEGFKVDFLPEEKSIDFGFCKLLSHYSVKDNAVIYEKEIVSDYLLLEKNQFKEYGEFFDALLKVNQQKINRYSGLVFSVYFESESSFRSCDIIPTKFFLEYLRLYLFWTIFSVL